jgi:hypothetical protein
MRYQPCPVPLLLRSWAELLFPHAVSRDVLHQPDAAAVTPLSRYAEPGCSLSRYYLLGLRTTRSRSEFRLYSDGSTGLSCSRAVPTSSSNTSTTRDDTWHTWGWLTCLHSGPGTGFESIKTWVSMRSREKWLACSAVKKHVSPDLGAGQCAPQLALLGCMWREFLSRARIATFE